MKEVIRLISFNIRMRLIDWLNKQEEPESIGWDWIKRINKLRIL